MLLGVFGIIDAQPKFESAEGIGFEWGVVESKNGLTGRGYAGGFELGFEVCHGLLPIFRAIATGKAEDGEFPALEGGDSDLLIG